MCVYVISGQNYPIINFRHFIVFRELIENSIAPKPQKISSTEHQQLVELMISKDNEFKTVLQLASEQAKIEKKMNTLKEQVELQVMW